MLRAVGLREMKVARTREQIVDVALDLFLEQGYDATTMEQIAERAEVGTTTLYRYFPSKDLLILDQFARSMDVASRLRERPADEPLSDSLGAAIRATIIDFEDPDGRFAALREIVDTTPTARARLWDLADQATDQLRDAIAERMHRPVDDMHVTWTTHLTFAVFKIAGEAAWSAGSTSSRAAVVDEVLQTLATLEPVIPSLPGTADRPR